MSKPFDVDAVQVSDRFDGFGELSAEEADRRLPPRGLQLLPYVRQGDSDLDRGGSLTQTPAIYLGRICHISEGDMP